MLIQGEFMLRFESFIYYYYIKFKIALLGISERPQLKIYKNVSNPRERRAVPATDIFKQSGKNRLLFRYSIRNII
jgi:hypothetical protein